MTQTKEKILFIGQNPQKFSGNGNMMHTCISQVDKEKYDCFALLYGDVPIELLKDPFTHKFDIPCDHIFLPQGQDWGARHILYFLEMFDVDQLIFVGIDIWRYASIFSQIKNLSIRKGFTWKVIVPYDLPTFRHDWLEWFQFPDYVFVYSEYGYNILSEHLSTCDYFRPKPRYFDLLNPPSPEEKKEYRSKLFPDATDDTTVIGFIGNNQLRKNIMRMMQGISFVANIRKKKDIIFYLHTDQIKGIYNIDQLATDLDFPDAVLRHNGNNRALLPQELAAICKTFDLYLYPTIQEGLSWTVIEMGLLGIPCLISASTSHFDYISTSKENGVFPIQTDDTAELPLPNAKGVSYVYAKACSPNAIAHTLKKVLAIKDNKKLESHSKAIRKFMLDWCNKSHDISVVLEKKIDKVTSAEFGEIL